VVAVKSELPKKPTLIIDTREKTPWDFEGDDEFEAIEHTKLDGGDYSIKGMEHLIVIERKANADELFNNFTQNKDRIYAEFERLKDHRMCVIVIEQSCEDVFNPNCYYVNKRGLNKRDFKMPVAVVASNLTELMVKHNTHVIFGGNKAKAMARGILLLAYKLHRQGKL
jgi:ERCC4-type nuclease